MYRTSFSTITFYVVFHRRSQNFLWGCTSFPQKVDDLFLVVILDTQTKITKLITASLKLSPTLHKFPHNFYFLLRLDKVHLQLTPHKLRPPPKKKNSPPGCARTTSAPPGYVYVAFGLCCVTSTSSEITNITENVPEHTISIY